MQLLAILFTHLLLFGAAKPGSAGERPVVGEEVTTRLTIVVQDIRNDQGQLCIGIFVDEASFAAGKPAHYLTVPKQEAKGGSLVQAVDLPPGIYGVSILDDENMDHGMDRNFIGLPKEGFGFSDYYHSGFSYPKFAAFRFQLRAADRRQVVVRLRYL